MDVQIVLAQAAPSILVLFIRTATSGVCRYADE
jgi:hypothetical protein